MTRLKLLTTAWADGLLYDCIVIYVIVYLRVAQSGRTIFFQETQNRRTMQDHGGHGLTPAPRPRPPSTASCATAASSAGRGGCGRCGRRAHTGQPGVDPGATAWTWPGTGVACRSCISMEFSSNFEVLLKGEPCWLGGMPWRCKPWHNCSRSCNTSRSIKLHHGNNNRPPGELGRGMKENRPVRANLDCEL